MLKEYFELQNKIHRHFGYKEDWVSIPLRDETGTYWNLVVDCIDEELSGGEVCFADSIDDLLDVETGNCYSAIIYQQRFLPKYIYRTDEHTMIVGDSRVDGNVFLYVFTNDNEVKPGQYWKDRTIDG